MNSAHRSIHGGSLVLIVGILLFSIALQRTGGVEVAADALVALVGGAGPSILLGSLFAITALMAPVALGIAEELEHRLTRSP